MGDRRPKTVNASPGNPPLGSKDRCRRDHSPKAGESWFVQNQTTICFNFLAGLFATHALLPSLQPYTVKFFKISYRNPQTGNYAAGSDDFLFITFCVVLLSGLRSTCMENVLAPLARRWGVKSPKEATRFSEQAWMLVYYNVFGPFGMYIYYYSPYFLDMDQLWTDWPQRELDRLTKIYILAQWAFWIQQILVIHIEKRRKDHWQMLSHHIVTIALIAASYAYHHSRVGHQIMILMDAVDLVFPLAKCLKYLGYTTICDLLFGLFVLVWFVTRHVLYLMTCWSLYADVPRLITQGCYRGSMDALKGPTPVPNDWSHIFEPFLYAKGLVCYSDRIMQVFLAFLMILQGMMALWSAFIVRVVLRVVNGNNVEDIRSDDEAERSLDSSEEEPPNEISRPIDGGQYIGGVDLKQQKQLQGARVTAVSSGVQGPEQREHRDFLKRIGCNKQID